MIWFQRLFPAFMLLHPWVFARATRVVGSPGRGELRRRMRALDRATLVALLLHLAVTTWLEGTRAPASPWRVAWPVVAGTIGSVLLWIRWAGPAMAARNPAYGPPRGEAGGPTLRSASLSPRHLLDPVGRRAWILGWILFALCAAVTLGSVAAGAPALLLLGLGWWLGMAVLGARKSLQEAEPRDPGDSHELERAYAELRAFRSWCYYALGLAGTLAFSAVALLVLLRPQLAGLTGAYLGCALGIAGALFGVLASLRRVRVNRLRLELERGSPG